MDIDKTLDAAFRELLDIYVGSQGPAWVTGGPIEKDALRLCVTRPDGVRFVLAVPWTNKPYDDIPSVRSDS